MRNDEEQLAHTFFVAWSRVSAHLASVILNCTSVVEFAKHGDTRTSSLYFDAAVGQSASAQLFAMSEPALSELLPEIKQAVDDLRTRVLPALRSGLSSASSVDSGGASDLDCYDVFRTLQNTAERHFAEIGETEVLPFAVTIALLQTLEHSLARNHHPAA